MGVVAYSVMAYVKVRASVSVAVEAVEQEETVSVTVLVLYTAAEGVYLQLSGACRFLDSLPVLWCCIFGFRSSKCHAQCGDKDGGGGNT